MRRCRGMVLVTSWLVACGGSTDGDGHPQTSDTQPTDSPPVVRLGWTDLQVVDVTDIGEILGLAPRQLEARDMDGDGDPEVVAFAAEPAPARVAVILSDEGLLVPPTDTQATGDEIANQVAIGDLDGDGFVDAVAVEPSTDRIAVAWGRAGGELGSPSGRVTCDSPHAVALADMTGDGKLDVITGSGGAFGNIVQVHPMGEGRTITPGAPFGGVQDVLLLVPGRFDADTNMDVAAANLGDGSITVLKGDGAGALSFGARFDVGAEPRGLAAGDLDGDGDLDLVVGTWGDGKLRVVLNQGEDGFAVGEPIASGGDDPGGLRLVDMDRDGDLDLVVVLGTGAIALLRGDGAGGLGAPETHTVGTADDGARSVALLDDDGDGRPDRAAIALEASSKIVLLGADF